MDLPADAGHHDGPRPGAPKVIILHATAGVDSRAWLTRTSVPPVSVHRLIPKNGLIYKLVPDELVAWGCGFGHLGPWYPGSKHGGCNAIALQIELENQDIQGDLYTPAQIYSTVLQCAEWSRMWGPLPVLGHFHIDENKKDPAWFPWGQFYKLLWQELVG